MSEATNRVLEAQLRRQKQHDKRQKEWETALKPTTIDGSGVLRQLGQQPLDSRQILPNTASLNRPIRPTSVPGGVVADWLPRIKKVEPEVKVKSNKQSIITVVVKRLKDMDGIQVPYEEIYAVVNGKYKLLLGNTELLMQWRETGETPESVTNTSIGTGSFTYSFSPGGFSAETSGSSYNGGSGEFTFAAKAVKIESATATANASAYPTNFSALVSYVNINLPTFLSVYATGGFTSDTDSLTNKVYATSNPLNVYVQTGGLRVYQVTSGPVGNGSTSTSATGVELLVRLKQPITWSYGDNSNGWVVWYGFKETDVDDENAKGASYAQQVFLGFRGRGKLVSASKAYVRRRTNDGNLTFFSGTTYEDVAEVPDPLTDPVAADFFDNTKSHRLSWDAWSPPSIVFTDSCINYSKESNYYNGKLSIYRGTYLGLENSLVGLPATTRVFEVSSANGNGVYCELTNTKEVPLKVNPLFSDEDIADVDVTGVIYFDK